MVCGREGNPQKKRGCGTEDQWNVIVNQSRVSYGRVFTIMFIEVAEDLDC